MNYDKLIKEALYVKENAYTPYFNFRVGAALLAKSGKIYTGCNVENSAGFGCCAERSALANAISKGEREFEAIAIVSDDKKYCYPCGVCRQALSEFGLDLNVVVYNNESIKIIKLKKLLPHAFVFKK